MELITAVISFMIQALVFHFYGLTSSYLFLLQVSIQKLRERVQQLETEKSAGEVFKIQLFSFNERWVGPKYRAFY